jgi:hypothetical protein
VAALGRTSRRRRGAAAHVVEEMIREGGGAVVEAVRGTSPGREAAWWRLRGETTGRRRPKSGGGERMPGGKAVARVLMARGCGLPSDRNFSPCLHSHAGRPFGEKSGIPKGY